ncbi:hypothetical protein T08_15083 [Trichinella sp. T8]|nr:hypothetical protein T08_15083 [Trichinella sp. T8]
MLRIYRREASDTPTLQRREAVVLKAVDCVGE